MAYSDRRHPLNPPECLVYAEHEILIFLYFEHKFGPRCIDLCAGFAKETPIATASSSLSQTAGTKLLPDERGSATEAAKAT